MVQGRKEVAEFFCRHMVPNVSLDSCYLLPSCFAPSLLPVLGTHEWASGRRCLWLFKLPAWSMLFFPWLLAYSLRHRAEADLQRPSCLNDCWLPSSKPQLTKCSHRCEFTLGEKKHELNDSPEGLACQLRSLGRIQEHVPASYLEGGEGGIHLLPYLTFS